MFNQYLEYFLYIYSVSRKYKFHNRSGVYFMSFATVNWIDICIRQQYFICLVNSIEYCRLKKGMLLYAYCLMPIHIHFIFQSLNDDPSGLIRDFKGYTSKELIKTIINNPQESKKEWILELLNKAGDSKSNVSNYQLWQHHNKPIELWTAKVIKQKIDYIHYNPVKSGFVVNPIDWKYSSARNYVDDHSILKIDDIGFIG